MKFLVNVQCDSCFCNNLHVEVEEPLEDKALLQAINDNEWEITNDFDYICPDCICR